MINMHKICVLDFETDGINPLTCEPTQLACLMIEPRTLEIIPDSIFNSIMRPTNIDDKNYIEQHKDTIAFHAKVQNKSIDEIIEVWKHAPLQKDVWTNFTAYLNKYHISQSKKSMFTAPIIAGYNILSFDWPILLRLMEKYGNLTAGGRQNMFFNRDKLDVMALCWYWFENLPEPDSISMDNLRDFFSISSENSHDALKDINDTADILIRFLKLTRKTADKVKFKGSFGKIDEVIDV